MKKINGYIHMSINIRGLLNYFKHKSTIGLTLLGTKLNSNNLKSYNYERKFKFIKNTKRLS